VYKVYKREGTVASQCGSDNFPQEIEAMDFGVFNVLQQRHRNKTSKAVLDEAMEHTRLAEELGFSRVWFAEHHFSNYSLCPSPLIACTHAAAITTTIRIGTAVLILPLHAPARMIAEIGMVDSLSNGRLDVGVGSGYQPYEFDRFNVDIANNKVQFHEMLDMLELGLREPHFSFDGEYYKQPQTAINVRTVQTPRPPIWVAGNDPRSHRRCARDGYIPFISGVLGSPRRMRRIRDQVEQCYREEGVDPTNMKMGALRFAFVSDSKKEVDHYIDSARYQQRIAISLRERRQEVVDDYWIAEESFPEELPWERIGPNMMAGDANMVAERLVEEIELYGPSHLNIYFSVGDVPHATAMRSMERWMNEVVPLVERHFGRPISEINDFPDPTPQARSHNQAAD
jgi:alkanesulfonate monooxygenase SsuD/methylene tetrahydromethanopterin reductase-like flavin-dependent oxidoreductase (luciferase family)